MYWLVDQYQNPNKAPLEKDPARAMYYLLWVCRSKNDLQALPPNSLHRKIHLLKKRVGQDSTSKIKTKACSVSVYTTAFNPQKPCKFPQRKPAQVWLPNDNVGKRFSTRWPLHIVLSRFHQYARQYSDDRKEHL